ncbi:MAG: aminomethyl-transferring glycine dehydrogenase subunit GcvPB, partial [Clostridiales bacterium]
MTQLLFERSRTGRCLSLVPEQHIDTTAYLPEQYRRHSELDLPELSENDISRHYTELAKRSYGV